MNGLQGRSRLPQSKLSHKSGEERQVNIKGVSREHLSRMQPWEGSRIEQRY